MSGARTYTIGEVSDLLGVKPHVIRYWEQEMPMLAPRKGLTGRRAYGQREIRLLLRVKHLLHEQRYTVEGARQRIWEEIEADRPEIRVLVTAVRDELLDAWMRLRRRDTRSSRKVRDEASPGDATHRSPTSAAHGSPENATHRSPASAAHGSPEDAIGGPAVPKL